VTKNWKIGLFHPMYFRVRVRVYENISLCFWVCKGGMIGLLVVAKKKKHATSFPVLEFTSS
jgi:hypothetical protein